MEQENIQKVVETDSAYIKTDTVSATGVSENASLGRDVQKSNTRVIPLLIAVLIVFVALVYVVFSGSMSRDEIVNDTKTELVTEKDIDVLEQSLETPELDLIEVDLVGFEQIVREVET